MQEWLHCRDETAQRSSKLTRTGGRFDPLKASLSIFKTPRPSIAPIHPRGSPVMHVKTVSEADTMEMTPTGHHYLRDFKLQTHVR